MSHNRATYSHRNVGRLVVRVLKMKTKVGICHLGKNCRRNFSRNKETMIDGFGCVLRIIIDLK